MPKINFQMTLATRGRTVELFGWKDVIMPTIESAFVALRAFENNPALMRLGSGVTNDRPRVPELDELLRRVVGLFESEADSSAHIKRSRTSLLEPLTRGTDGTVIEVVLELSAEKTSGSMNLEGFRRRLIDLVQSGSEDLSVDLAAITHTPNHTNGKLLFEELVEGCIGELNRVRQSRSVLVHGSLLSDRLSNAVHAVMKRGILLAVVEDPTGGGGL